MFCTFDGEMSERPPPWEYSSKSISSFCSFINSSQNKVIKTMTKENTNVFVVIKQQRTISTTYFYGKITATETESVKSKEKIDFALDEGEHDVKIDVTSQFGFCLCFFFVPMKFTQKRKKEKFFHQKYRFHHDFSPHRCFYFAFFLFILTRILRCYFDYIRALFYTSVLFQDDAFFCVASWKVNILPDCAYKRSERK